MSIKKIVDILLAHEKKSENPFIKKKVGKKKLADFCGCLPLALPFVSKRDV